MNGSRQLLANNEPRTSRANGWHHISAPRLKYSVSIHGYIVHVTANLGSGTSMDDDGWLWRRASVSQAELVRGDESLRGR